MPTPSPKPSIPDPEEEFRAEYGTPPDRSTKTKEGLAVILGILAGGTIFAVAFLSPASPYGLLLFLGSPFTLGLVTAAVYNQSADRSGDASHWTVQVALMMAAGALLITAVEGMLCIVMAYPLAALLAAVGGLVGRELVRADRFGPSQLILLLVLAPLLAAFDLSAPEPALREIVTRVEIDAPPEAVWPHVIAFTELPPPRELAFRLGIAYPVRARIVGQGVGAVRYCEFSTGAFVEPITRWEAPYRLSFDVVSRPPTMQEWSPYDISPLHLTESLISERGEFRLVPLPGGRTRLEGSTWYRHGLFPQIYWNLWSDALIHRIHRRVLRHVASLSEAESAQPSP